MSRWLEKVSLRLLPTAGLVLAISAQADLSLEADPATVDAFFASPAATGEPAAAPTPAPWPIRKTAWEPADERRFSEFVTAIGRARCRTTDQCLKSEANPYRDTDPADARFYSDCADLPYYFRAYFAWKNGLPFAYTASVAAIPDPRAQPTPHPSASPAPPRDIRYSPFGNRPVSRAVIQAKLDRAGQPVRPDAWKALRDLLNRVSTAVFRIGPAADQGRIASDLYPVRLDRDSIRAGTAIYDPAGHVAMVYAVESDGRVLFIDAHPDNSLTRGTYGKKFIRANPGQGAGFKNWRPIRLEGAVRTPEGDWVGGRLVAATNAELADYSTAQYYGTDPDPRGNWKRGRFVWGGRALEFHDFLRHALSEGSLRYDPLREFRLMIRGLCTDVRDRVAAVELALRNGIAAKAHPARLPENIYGSTGEWEDYATPSRDARLKTSFKEAYDRAAEFIALWGAGDPSLVYDGADLRRDLGRVYAEESAACQIGYRPSDGGALRTLELAGVAARAFELSFDPYHCAELRWGATAAAELATCDSDAPKLRWHRALRRLRNQTERTYDARMDYTVEEMEDPARGGRLGAENPPVVDFEELFRP